MCIRDSFLSMPEHPYAVEERPGSVGMPSWEGPATPQECLGRPKERRGEPRGIENHAQEEAKSPQSGQPCSHREGGPYGAKQSRRACLETPLGSLRHNGIFMCSVLDLFWQQFPKACKTQWKFVPKIDKSDTHIQKCSNSCKKTIPKPIC